MNVVRSNAMRCGIIAALAVVCPAVSVVAQPESVAVEYTIGLHEPQTQYVEMTATFHDLTGDVLDVHLPTWRPGRYVILDFAGTITGVSAESGDGSTLVIEKTAKSSWRVDLGGSTQATIRYRVYANSLGDRTRHVDDSHAFLDGSAVFLYSDDTRAKPARVVVEAPSGWAVATGLEAVPGAENTFLAPNYDILIDSPFEIGRHELIRFDVDGVAHEIAVWGEASYSPEKFKADFAAIIAAQRDVFGEMPYDRFVFMLHIAPGLGGGTEHYNSTIMQASPERFDSDDSYRRFLGLVSHEMFHTWNVKRLRPAGLNPYDYLGENYTTLLWVSEGTTSYYGALTLARTGITKPDAYLKSLGGSIGAMERHVGATIQSLEESSFDAWVKFNRSTPDSANTTVSFYSKGSLVSLLLDMELRGRTSNRVTLDTVMRELYERFPLDGPGFTPADLLGTVERLSSTSFGRFFEKYVRGTQPLPMAEALMTAGLELKRGAGEDEPYLGFSVSGEDTGVVRRIRADGPAYKAGLNVGDEIVAFNGDRMRGSNLDVLVKEIKPGDTVALLLFRRDELREISFVAGARNDAPVTLTRVENPTEAQVAVYESWLKQPWPDDGDEAPPDAAEIDAVVDDWHRAAAAADLDGYFGAIAEDGVYLGSDDWERWPRDEFLAFAKPHFDQGKGWTFLPRDRVVAFSADGRTAWFDEKLDSEHMGLCRGTGVLQRRDGRWKIVHYSLTITIPNDLVGEVKQRIDEHKAEPDDSDGGTGRSPDS
ncbi:MAG: nuclear transport factor 2 family protein [Planctomycetes bacterium]|nr:nuclear transport factor 2 family protein [Planctomycetota bacterium]